LAEEARAELVGPEQGTWLARLDLERENLLAAHAWCDRAEGGAELGLRLVFALKLYMIYRGFLALLSRATVEALARPGAGGRSLARCRALHSAGQLGFLMGHYDEAQGYLEESLAIARELGDQRRVGTVLEELGAVLSGQGDLPAARRHFEEALSLARELGNKRELAAATNALAQFHRMQGELDTAEPLYEQMLGLARALDDRESIAIGLLNLAMVAVGREAGDSARDRLLEAVAIAEEIGSKPAGQCALEVAAGLAALRRDWVRAARYFGSAEAQIAQTGLKRDPADEAFLVPLVAHTRQALGAPAFAAAETVGRGLNYEQALGDARAWLEGPH
jgi:non-specific serine/threonine protein kinase